MTTQHRIAAVLARTLVLALLGLVGGTAIAQHDHGHAAPTTPLPSLDNGRPWPTDEPLRTGMGRIRDAALPLIAGASPGANEAQALADVIRDNIAFMIQHCSLAPQADATLHALIGELLGAADALAANPTATEPLRRIANALDQYPRYFDHPGWQGTAAHAH